jgi:hypothetical protein
LQEKGITIIPDLHLIEKNQYMRLHGYQGGSGPGFPERSLPVESIFFIF